MSFRAIIVRAPYYTSDELLLMIYGESDDGPVEWKAHQQNYVAIQLATVGLVTLPPSFQQIRNARIHNTEPRSTQIPLYSLYRSTARIFSSIRTVVALMNRGGGVTHVDHVIKPSKELYLSLVNEIVPYGKTFGIKRKRTEPNVALPIIHVSEIIAPCKIMDQIRQLPCFEPCHEFSELTILPTNIPLLSIPCTEIIHDLAHVHLLRDIHQENAYNKTMEIFLGPSRPYTSTVALLDLACAIGKTVVALHVGVRLINTGLVDGIYVLIHRKKLVKQWEKCMDNDIVNKKPGMLFRCATFQGRLAHPETNFAISGDKPYPRYLLIIDEVHHTPAPTFMEVVAENTPPGIFPYIIGLSGTMERDDGRTQIMYNVFGTVPCIKVTQIDAGRRLHKLWCFDVEFPVPLNMDDFGAQGSNNSNTFRNNVHSTCILRADWLIRTCIIYHLCNGFTIESQHPNHILVICHTIAHVDLLVKCFMQSDEADYPKTHCNLRYETGKKSCVMHVASMGGISSSTTISVASVQLMGEGTDDDSIDCVVLAEGSNYGPLMQSAYRMRSPETGTLVFISSILLRGAKDAKKKNMTSIKKELYVGIDHEETTRVRLQ